MKMIWFTDCSDPPTKVAATEVSAFKATVHVSVPEHPPDQPVNTKPGFGAAVRVTVVPVANAAAQVGPQLIPAGLLVTVPVPEPVSETVNRGAAAAANPAAAAEVALFRTIVQVADVPEHAPDQPENEFPLLGVAVRVTDVPPLKVALQVCPQVIPGGELLTAPPPEPVMETFN